MRTRSMLAGSAAALAAVVGLASIGGQVAASASSAPADPPGTALARAGVHYSGKPLLNPEADLAKPVPGSDALTDALDASQAAKGITKRFNTWSGHSPMRWPEGVATGDYNDDGAIDIAYARSDFYQPSMTVELNRGDGTMAAPVVYPTTADESTDIKAGDLDGDLDLDLVVVSMGSSLVNNIVDLYFNDGKGKFTHRTDTGGLGPQKMALADLDADGDLDIAMSSGLFGEVMSVLRNNGDRTFAPDKQYPVGKYPKGIATADLDGDHDIDIALAREDPETDSTKVQIWRNSGSASFTMAKEITLIVKGDPSLVVDDFNDDGKIDLAVGMIGEFQLIMINQGHLTFRQDSYTTGYSAWDLTSGDLDGDGDSDVVLATLGSNSTGDISILRNLGNGTFTPSQVSSGYNPHDVGIADFDGDGKADIVVAEGATNTAAIHFQRAHFEFGPPPLVETYQDLLVGSIENSDVDHDDDIDAVTSINDPFGGIGYVQIMKNGGKANFTQGEVIDSGLTSDGGVGHVEPADLDDDGWDDLVWTINQFNEPVGAIVISMNEGHGSFGSPEVFAGTARNGYVATGDFDDDGDLDLASSQFTQKIAIYLNDGDGNFGVAAFFPVAEFPGMIITDDLTGDGVADLATVHNGVYGSSKAISVLRGRGDGTFAQAVTYTVGQGPIGIVAADLDKDGDLDLATSNNGGDDVSTFADESTTILINRGDGRFEQITTYPGEVIGNYLSEWAIDAGDVNADGKIDIVVSNVIGNNAGVYYGGGDGTLKPQVRYGLQNGALDLTLGDFNGDGRIDVVASGYLQSVDPLFPPAGIMVLKNRGSRSG